VQVHYLKGPGAVTMVDVVVSLQISLSGKETGALDEERIVKALTKHLKVSYKKIDPLQLDLDVVTKTIPRLFALKHLVVPVGITDGKRASQPWKWLQPWEPRPTS
jgi:general secretion pathway protein E